MHWQRWRKCAIAGGCDHRRTVQTGESHRRQAQLFRTLVCHSCVHVHDFKDSLQLNRSNTVLYLQITFTRRHCTCENRPMRRPRTRRHSNSHPPRARVRRVRRRRERSAAGRRARRRPPRRSTTRATRRRARRLRSRRAPRIRQRHSQRRTADTRRPNRNTSNPRIQSPTAASHLHCHRSSAKNADAAEMSATLQCSAHRTI